MRKYHWNSRKLYILLVTFDYSLDFLALSSGAQLPRENPASLTGKEFAVLLEKFKNGNTDAGTVKEILNIVKDVREIQSNQVGSDSIACSR